MSNARSRYGYLPRRWRCISIALEGQVQLIYRTLTSTGSSLEKTMNWYCTPQQISFAVVSTGGSSWFISASFVDPTNVYPSPTAFTLLTGSSNPFATLGTSGVPTAAYQLTLNV
jgi:hypothetical protein